VVKKVMDVDGETEERKRYKGIDKEEIKRIYSSNSSSSSP
jgi:hypothetical protein